MSREAFGSNLRRRRIRCGITLESLEHATRVPGDLWRGLEENDLSRWPSGIYARAYVRQYAMAVGLDPDATVDEFCRSFPQGDRRAERVVRGQATIVGHRLDWSDDLVGLVIDKDRRADAEPGPDRLPELLRGNRGRIVAAVVDTAAVVTVGLTLASVFPLDRAFAVAGVAVLYHAGGITVLGCTPSAWAIDTFIRSKLPTENLRGPRLLRLLVGRSDR